MNIRIYQVNMKRDTNNVAFMRYELLEKLQGWSGKSSISSKGISRFFASFASSLISCVENRSSSVGRVKSLFLPAIG